MVLSQVMRFCNLRQFFYLSSRDNPLDLPTRDLGAKAPHFLKFDFCKNIIYFCGIDTSSARLAKSKDEIDLVGHRGLLPEVVTQQCAVDMQQKMHFVP